MKGEIILLNEWQLEYISFYTIGVHGRKYCEFDDFQKRMMRDQKDSYQFQELMLHLKTLGNLYGAQEQYFKREHYAERLPGPTFRFFDSDGETDFGLRLYCIRLSEKVVILLNGDRKTARKVNDCKKCKPHFIFANKVSDAIYKAQSKGEFEIDNFYIKADVLNI